MTKGETTNSHTETMPHSKQVLCTLNRSGISLNDYTNPVTWVFLHWLSATKFISKDRNS